MILDVYTIRHTGCSSFKALCEDLQPDYEPTFIIGKSRNREEKEKAALADAYDAEMRRRGDARRAIRYTPQGWRKHQ